MTASGRNFIGSEIIRNKRRIRSKDKQRRLKLRKEPGVYTKVGWGILPKTPGFAS